MPYVGLPTFFGRRAVLPVTFFRRGRTTAGFYVTDDAGRSWRLAALHRSHGFEPKRVFLRLVPAAVASQTSWWIADEQRTAVTSDGGKSWRVSTPVPLTRYRRITSLSAADTKHAWAITISARGGGALYGTSDGGRTWQRIAATTQAGAGRATAAPLRAAR